MFVSGHADIPMSVRAIKAGALDFFTKPFEPDLLLAAIHAGIAQRNRAPSQDSDLPVARRSTGSEAPKPAAKSGHFAEIVGRE